MQKLLLVSNDFPPSVGGIAHIAHMICKNLDPDKLSVLAAHVPGDREFDGRQAFSIRRVRYFYRKGFLSLLSVVNFGIRAILAAKRDGSRMLLFGAVFPLGMIGLVSRYLGLPYIVEVYGSDILIPRHPVITWLRSRILLSAKWVITISEFTKQHLLHLGVQEERIHIMHPKIDMPAPLDEDHAMAFRSEKGLQGKRIILSVGRLVERKGFDRVIEAAPEVVRTYPDAVFVFVGDGPDRQRLMKLAKDCDIEASILFVGEKTQEEVAPYYNACDIFVMPSRYIVERGDAEGFGVVFLEANAHRKPVIGGNSGGIPDAIVDGKSGLLCDPDDVGSLVCSIKKLLGDPALSARLGEQGYLRVKREFTSERYREEFARVLGCGNRFGAGSD